MKTSFVSRVARILALCALTAVAGSSAAQQTYPGKPIRFIVPFPPGGSTDPVARLVGRKLTESWGQQVIVDNRPGGNTVIGTEALVKSAPDGYTILLVAASTHIINSLLLHKLPYDSLKDFAPVATLTKSEFVLVVHPSIPATNLRQFVALAKSKPGQLNYASSGFGNLNHFAAELFNMMTDIKTQHVPYKGGGPAIADLIGGQVQVHFAIPLSVLPYIRTGKLKAIAIGGETRFSGLPDVPTFTEAGLPGFELRSSLGVFAPARTPAPIIDKLSIEIARILAMSDTKEKLDAQGLAPFISTPDQFAAVINADLARFAKIVKTTNIKLD